MYVLNILGILQKASSKCRSSFCRKAIFSKPSQLCRRGCDFPTLGPLLGNLMSLRVASLETPNYINDLVPLRKKGILNPPLDRMVGIFTYVFLCTYVHDTHLNMNILRKLLTKKSRTPRDLEPSCAKGGGGTKKTKK